VPRRIAALVLVVAVVGVAPSAAAAPLLKRIVLTPRQVGTGYRMRMLDQGDVVKNQVSLDLCDFRFPSERLRTGRLQFVYLHGGEITQVSNEVVSYRAGGARRALAELRKALTACPRHPVIGPVHVSVPTTHRLTRLGVHGLSLSYVAVLDRVSGTIRGKKVTRSGIAVYEIRGNVLSAIYTDGRGSISAQRKVAFHSATESAKNLTHALP
jgi:hypothetical protein